MKFWEAMKALDEGKLVRIVTWPKHKFIDNESMTGWLYAGARDRDYNEWEVYSEPEETLSMMDVVKGLKEGKKFRRLGWPNDGYYIVLFPASPGITGPDGKAWWVYPRDLEAQDWVEVLQ